MFPRSVMSRFVVSLVVILFGTGHAWADKGKNNGKGNQEKRDDQKVNAAERDVKEARDKLQDAERDLKKALDAKQDTANDLKNATAKLKKTRDQVEARLEKEYKIESALADQSAAQTAYDKAKEPVLAALKAKPEYLAALKAAEDARTRIKELRQDLTLSQSDRAKQLSDASLATLAPSKLETAAIDADSPAREAKARLGTAADKVASLREKVRKAMESDGDIKAAQKAFDQAKAADDKAKDQLATEQRQVADAREKLAREQAQLAQAKAADKKNDGKNNKKNKK